MTSWKDKVQNALDEGRILLLGTQILLGFQFREPLEHGFKELGSTERLLKLGALELMLLALGLLLVPVGRHILVEERRDSASFHAFVGRVFGGALVAIAIALGLDVGRAADVVVQGCGLLVGAGVTAMAMMAWFGVEGFFNLTHGGARMTTSNKTEEPELKDKIRHTLTEARMVLPGVQALLGFQLAGVMMEKFRELPHDVQRVHLGSLLLLALTAAILMTPAAWHRLVEKGEMTERFSRLAGFLVVAAMPTLAVGLGMELFVVGSVILGSHAQAMFVSVVTTLALLAMWTLAPLLERLRRASEHGVPQHS